MIAARLDLDASQLPDNLGQLHGAIRDAIPAGIGKGHVGSTRDEMRDAAVDRLMTNAPFERSDQRKTAAAANQFGSLGSGNHFVEVCLDESDRVWLVLHSGSRGVGNQLAHRRGPSVVQGHRCGDGGPGPTSSPSRPRCARSSTTRGPRTSAGRGVDDPMNG